MTIGGQSAEARRLADAKVRTLELLDQELAMVKREVIARLGETYHYGDPRNIDPHVTGLALRALEDEGTILTTPAIATRGGAAVATIQPTDQRRRGTYIERAAGRKRLLYARYLGWASGSSRYPHGVIGPHGETAVRRAILDSTALQPAAPAAGPVAKILNVRLDGPADSGGYLSPLVGGIPQPPVTVLIEIKSIREWIYPDASEIYQVLDKCVRLKQAHPTAPIVPILVCRRAQKTAFYMAKDLGFVIIDMRAQFLGSAVSEPDMLEVRNELGFGDLYLGTGPSLPVRDRLRDHLSPVVYDFAKTWAATVAHPEVPDLVHRLRGRLSRTDRAYLVNRLRDAARTLGGRVGW